MTQESADPYRYGERIEQVVAYHAARRPQAVAVQQGDDVLTYAELVAGAERVAAGLWSDGVRAGDTVLVDLERSPDLVVALLGILRAGSCYILLDSGWPASRIEDVSSRSNAVLTMDRSRLTDLLDRPRRPAPPALTDGRQAAAVFFTSGSTGRPKGVLSPHRGTIRTLVGYPVIPLDPTTVMLQAAPLPWDGHALEQWAPLLNGGRSVLLPRDRRALDADSLAAAIADGVNTMFLTTSLFNLFVEECPSLLGSLRILMTGGERVSMPHVRAIRAAAPGLRLIHVYGPAECTIYTTAHVVRDADVTAGSTDIPIGTPVPRTSVVVVDENGTEVPDGATGELLAGGDGLALGYLADAEETGRRFVDRPDRRYYRTGDLVVRDADGLLRFRGRADRQVKIRGVRIEPGEVETVLEGHPAVRSAHVLRLADASGQRATLACAYTTVTGSAPDPGSLRAHITEHLVEAMRPTVLLHLTRLPLNANGKVDAAALAERLRAEWSPAATAAPPPSDGLLGEVRALLGLPRLTERDDLLDAGITSLDAVRLAARAGARTGHTVSIADIYRHRTLEAVIAGTAPQPDVPHDHAESPGGRAPLSHAQQRFWLAETLRPGLTDNMLVFAYELVGPLNIADLSEALQCVIRANAVLRTVYPDVEGEPSQKVLGAGTPLPLSQVIIDDPTSVEPLPVVAERLTQDWWDTPFELDHEPPIRARLGRLGPDRHLLCLHVHHIAFDGASEAILIRQLAEAYANVVGERTAMPSGEDEYQRYATEEAGNVDRLRAAHLPFWREKLRGADEPLLPAPASDGSVEPARRERTLIVDPVTVKALHLVAGGLRVPVSAVLIAAAAQALGAVFGREDICLGTITNGRTDLRYEQVVGYFVNALPLALRIPAEASPAELVATVGAEWLAALEHSALPFDEVVRALAPDRDRHPFFQAWCVMQDAAPAAHGANLSIESVRVRPPRTETELWTEAFPQPDGSWLVVSHHRADGLDGATADALMAGLHRSLLLIADLAQRAG